MSPAESEKEAVAVKNSESQQMPSPAKNDDEKKEEETVIDNADTTGNDPETDTIDADTSFTDIKANQEEAESLPEAVQLKIQVSWREQVRPELVDNSYVSGLSFMGGEDVTIRTEEGDIRYLYILWDKMDHTSWTLHYDGGETVEDNHFQHELVEVPVAGASLVMTLPEYSIDVPYPRIVEIYAFTEGRLPSWVQRWEKAEGHADILLFPTHSDDEFVFMGGVIPWAVSRGYSVEVCYFDSHFSSVRERTHERLDSLWEAGAVRYPIISEVLERRNTSDESVIEYQVEQIRRFTPTVICGHSETGESGHWAHVQNTACLKNAVLCASDEAQYPDSAEQYGVWDTPKTYLHQDGDTILDYETPLEGYEGRTAYKVACDAFSLCLTQVSRDRYGVCSFDSPYDTHIWGLYRSNVGADIQKNDLFENIA